MDLKPVQDQISIDHERIIPNKQLNDKEDDAEKNVEECTRRYTAYCFL